MKDVRFNDSDKKGVLPTSRLKPVALVGGDASPESDLLAYKLEVDGFLVVKTSDGAEVLKLADAITADILIIDWSLQNICGIELCRQLKTNPKSESIPIIMVSSHSEESDCVCGLNAGADDYVVKPYSVPEMLARVRAKLRHSRPSAVGAMLEFDTIKVDTETHRVFVAGRSIQIGPTEFRLLAALLERPGFIWSREQLLDRVWGRGINAEKHVVAISINRLRKALGQDNLNYPVRTVKGYGYALG